MVEDRELLEQETSVLKVLDLSSSNITNCRCLVVSSTKWGNGGIRLEMIPGAEIGKSYEVKMNLYPMGSGVNWETQSIKQID